MKKYITAFGIAAVASLMVAATASADVARTQGETTTTTTITTTTTTAKFTVTQPAGQVGQWDNLWTHDYAVKVNADGTFVGTGKVYGHDQSGEYSANETISGTFIGDESVTLTATRDDGVVYSLVNAPFGGVVTNATTSPAVSWDVEMKVSQPELTITEENETTDTTTTTNYKNHGEYVSEMGGGAEAAHSPIGKPIKASK